MRRSSRSWRFQGAFTAAQSHIRQNPGSTPGIKERRSELNMRFWKNDLTRFFALGFAGGAALVFGAMGIDAVTELANGVIPPAHAASPQS
jgi:hypothetical protein